ncbi:MAG: hypothetical protein QOE76_208 [Frankiales bacterium]|jgi:hypothetical protein|nr:hypothetical protein [Frankiales bacterium]MDX6242485.1 hypothetical protein [Frankiales bacterium]
MTLRSRVRRAIALTVTVALLLFGVPLAVVLDRLIQSTALTGLQRDATRAVAGVPDNTLQAGSQVKVARGVGGTQIGVYDAQGHRVAGVGPATSALAGRVGDGREHDGHDAGALSVVVPVLSDTTVAGSVRAAIPLGTVRARVVRAWALLLLLALAIVLVAIVLARRAARRISVPFEQITSAALQMGEGRYDLGLPVWGIAEADAAGTALRESAKAIDELVSHERDFIRHASHQLRTPLTAALLHLQASPPDVAAALERSRQLETTIDDLLALRAVAEGGRCAPEQVAADAVARWDSPERPVVLRADDEAGDAAVPAAALRQALDVLLDNAIRHGAGAITITVEPYGDLVAVEVADNGDGFAPGAEPGTGMQLASGIALRAHGALLIRRRAPHPRVALLLPRSETP